MYTLLRQRRPRWLGHVRRMEDGRIPKYILYGELALGRRITGRPHLRYKDVCMRKRYEGCRHRHYVLGARCSWSHKVEECSTTTPQARRRQTDGCSSGQTSTQKGGQQLHPTETTHRLIDDVMSAIKTVIPTLVFSALNDAATTQPEINKIKNMYHPWSSLRSLLFC